MSEKTISTNKLTVIDTNTITQEGELSNRNVKLYDLA